jgi:hypothetical protein
MTICNKYFEKADEAITFLAGLAESNENYLFRGHSKIKDRLSTTLSRFTSIPHEDWRSGIDMMLESFMSGLAKLGINPPIDTESRLDWMEFARHHGVPTPCIDFSYSPYVALFFSFNGVRKKHPKPEKTEYSLVYVLNIIQMGIIWAEFAAGKDSKTSNIDSLFNRFRFPKDGLFQYGFPAGVLQLIPFPGKYNYRMQRQFGALLYDTLDYKNLGFLDLEDFIEKQKEPEEYLPNRTVKVGSPTLIKIHINQQSVSEVFTKLELIGVTGGTLYMDANGVALDVINAYNYNPKTQYLRGVTFPEIDESKMYQ